jgi:uncharacterized membrane protein
MNHAKRVMTTRPPGADRPSSGNGSLDRPAAARSDLPRHFVAVERFGSHSLRKAPCVNSDLIVLRFPRLEGAEQAFADVRERAGHAPWMDEVAFVEHRRSGRLVVRGTLAGHYLDAEEDGDVIGRHTGAGALTGALAGAIFGPPGLAAGLVSGAAAGGMVEAGEAEQLDGDLVTEVRDAVPDGSSALVLLAEPRHVDTMIDAFRGTHARVAIRRTLSADAMAALEAVLADAPRVSRDQRRTSG